MDETYLIDSNPSIVPSCSLLPHLAYVHNERYNLVLVLPEIKHCVCIVIMLSKACKKPCGPQKICNPASGRCVLKSGKLGRLLKSKKSRSKSKLYKRRSKSRTAKIPAKIEPVLVPAQENLIKRLPPVVISGNDIIIPVIRLANPVDIFRPPGIGSSSMLSFKVSKNLLDRYSIPNLTGFLNNNQVYLEGLSSRQRIVLSGYTSKGDELVNMYMKNETKDLEEYILTYWGGWNVDYTRNPLYYQLRDLGCPENAHAACFWTLQKDPSLLIKTFMSAIKSYISELTEIFNKSPKLTSPITVFRGVKNTYYKTTNSDIFQNKDFMSTTLSPKVALRFMNSASNCCFKQINLIPGARAIFIEPLSRHPEEFEILLPPGNRFVISEIEMNLTQKAQGLDEMRLLSELMLNHAKVSILQQV